ncbi:MAG: hypothetical protein U7123_08510 [Potamolinea sp.]
MDVYVYICNQPKVAEFVQPVLSGGVFWDYVCYSNTDSANRVNTVKRTFSAINESKCLKRVGEYD